MSSPCNENVRKDTGLSESEAEQLLLKMKNLAEERSHTQNLPINDAIRQIAGEISREQLAFDAIQERNNLLTIKAKRHIHEYVSKFSTVGEGLIAFLQGSSKKVEGARLSIDYQSRSLHGKYLGRLAADMEDQGVLHDFLKNVHEQDIYREMGELGRENGQPGVTKNPVAMRIAKIIESVTDEMIARENRAGAYIQKLPGYIIRQTHDQHAIRLAGGEGNNPESKSRSFQAWYNFTRPLLDDAATFKGADAKLVMRNIHEGLYTGVHGEASDPSVVNNIMVQSPLAGKASASRVLHFKDADAAYKYNQEFGIKNLKDSVFSDLFYRSRAISMMENLGPNPRSTFDRVIRELGEQARLGEDAAKQVDSLSDWRVAAAFNEVSGFNEIPKNFSLNRTMQTIKVVAQLSKMGSVLLSAFSDKAFLQSEMSYQGISGMDTFVKQITGMANRSPEDTKKLRLMGVALDGMIGNTAARYTMHSTVAGFAHHAQQKLFDLNFMNWWTDVNKASAAELMSAHLGMHADLPFEQLPGDLQKVLSLYEIKGKTWDAIRDTTWSKEGTGDKFVSADMVKNIPIDRIDGILEEQGLKVTDANRLRAMDRIESQLRTYFSDRIDIAVPTPGVAERKYATLNTQSGTIIGEAVRLLTLFKSFPLTIMTKVLGREVYGNGAPTVMQFLKSDHQGKFRVAQLIAMATVLGYAGGAVRDALAGKTPKPLLDEDGKINTGTLNDAMLRGGGLGLMGDFMFNEYDRSYKSFSATMSGPIVGQLDPLMAMQSKLRAGGDVTGEAGKFLLGNSPYINLFYIRPVLNYLVLWNLEEMMSPGATQRRVSAAERRGQHYFIQQ